MPGRPVRADQVEGFEKTNYTATTNPTAANDNTQRYAVGSKWINTSTGAYFVCVDASTGAAIWLAPTSTVYAQEVVVGTGSETQSPVLGATPAGGGTANTPSGYYLAVYRSGQKIKWVASSPTGVLEYTYNSGANRIEWGSALAVTLIQTVPDVNKVTSVNCLVPSSPVVNV